MSTTAEIHDKHKIIFMIEDNFLGNYYSLNLFSENKNAVHKECIGKTQTQNKGGKCVKIYVKIV
jgi:hypothetical protein